MQKETLYTGTKAGAIVGLDPGIITAWVLRKIIKPAVVESLTERKTVFKYDLHNLIELAILKHLSEYLRIRLDIPKFLPKNLFKDSDLLNYSLLANQCYIVILVSENKEYDAAIHEPPKPNEKRIKPYKIEAKILKTLDQITKEIKSSTSALIINSQSLFFKIIQKI